MSQSTISSHNSNIAILGASKGIGRACAQKALELNFNEIHLVSRNIETLKKNFSRESSSSTNLQFKALDLLNEEACTQWIHQLEDQKHFPRTWIFCAGGSSSGKLHPSPFESMDWSESKDQIELNLLMPMRITQLILRELLRPGPAAHIIYVSSQAGSHARPGRCPYSASKWGLNGFAKSLFEELRDTELKISLVAPGYVETELIPKNPELDRSKMIAPEDIAHAIFSLLSYSKRCCPLEYHLMTNERVARPTS